MSGQPLRALVYMALSGLAFALMNALIRIASEELHTLVIVFFRNFFALVALLPWALGHLKDIQNIHRPWLHVLRSCVGLVGMYLFFYSLKILPLADTVAISFAAPLLVLVGAVLFLGEKVRMRRWLATMVGFFGIVLIVQPGAEGFNPQVWVALLASLFIAMALLLVKAISRSNNPHVMVFFMTLVTTPLSLVPALFVWQTPSLIMLGCLAVIGIAGALAHLFFTMAFKIADASLVVSFDYLRLPFTATFAFVLFDQVPGLNLWLGTALIMCATVYITHRENQLTKADSKDTDQAFVAKSRI